MFLPPQNASQGKRYITIRMLGVCLNHAHGRSCEHNDEGNRSYFHDAQRIPFGQYRQPDQPKPEGRTKSTRNRIISMKLGDLLSSLDSGREDRGFDSPSTAWSLSISPPPRRGNGLLQHCGSLLRKDRRRLTPERGRAPKSRIRNEGAPWGRSPQRTAKKQL